jgi:hypothetical protein
MPKRILVLALTLLVGLGAYSQHKISGIIIDEESGKPVPDAFVIQENGAAVVSDSAGQFSIELRNIPAKIKVSHVSYGQSEINIEKLPQGILVIRIQKMISNLEEVQISAERMRILTEKDDFSLQDFAIDSTHLWMLGYINNRPKNGRLWLANLFGDTIRSIPVEKPEKLYRDVFGNVHLFINDSVFQLFGTDDSIGFVDIISKEMFLEILDPIKAFYSDKLIYQKYLPYQEGLHTYYYSTDDPQPRFLTCTRDTVMEALQEDEFVYGRYAGAISAIMNASSQGDKLWFWQQLVGRKKIKHLVFYRGIKTPMIGAGDVLYILNQFKDSLLSYDTAGQFAGAIYVDFHRFVALKSRNYKDFRFIYDQAGNEVYYLEKKNVGWKFCGLNTQNGKLEDIPLPDFAGMTSVTVNNNAVYFLYPEKSYPFYTRLYRFQL